MRCDLSGYSGRVTGLEVELRVFARGQRVRRAGVALAASGLAALASGFIPVAHLLLVPGFLVGGGFVAARQLRTTAVVRSARGDCPDCGFTQAFELASRWTGERTDTSCRRCSRRLVLAPIS